MYMETPRMVVRDFLPEDAAGLFEILGDTETMAQCEPAYDFEKTKQFLTDFCIGRRGAAAAVLRDSGKLIGYVLFHELDEGVYEMGWIFHRSFWRQSYAFEACRAVIDHAFGRMHIHKIFAETVDAVKSVGLMEKLGMKPEGVQRKQTKDNRGTWADLYLYGLLEEDWREQRS